MFLVSAMEFSHLNKKPPVRKKRFVVISAPSLFVTPQSLRIVNVCKNQCYQLYTANLWSLYVSYFICYTSISFIAKTPCSLVGKGMNLHFGEEKWKLGTFFNFEYITSSFPILCEWYPTHGFLMKYNEWFLEQI